MLTNYRRKRGTVRAFRTTINASLPEKLEGYATINEDGSCTINTGTEYVTVPTGHYVVIDELNTLHDYDYEEFHNRFTEEEVPKEEEKREGSAGGS